MLSSLKVGDVVSGTAFGFYRGATLFAVYPTQLFKVRFLCFDMGFLIVEGFNGFHYAVDPHSVRLN
jgi:hypothetical protein